MLLQAPTILASVFPTLQAPLARRSLSPELIARILVLKGQRVKVLSAYNIEALRRLLEGMILE